MKLPAAAAAVRPHDRRHSKSPSRQQLRGAVPVWVRPELVVEVEFRRLHRGWPAPSGQPQGLAPRSQCRVIASGGAGRAVITRDAG